MRPSSAAPASLLLLLVVGCFMAEGTRHRIIVRAFNTKFKIDWWDNVGRSEPYRILFNKSGVKSIYKFDETGNVKTLTVNNNEVILPPSSEVGSGSPEVQSTSNGSRMLHAPGGDAGEDTHSNRRRLYACADCEDTWNTLCGRSLEEVCSWVALLPGDFSEDENSSFTRMCTGFGEACETSAFDACEGQCIEEECDPNPCQNGGTCSSDPGGGHVCSCASGYGGMACQTDTSSLDAFYIEVEFFGTWTDAREAVFRSAAERWSEIITHVPCGGNTENPAGRLLISSTLEEIDGVGGTLGSAGPNSIWGGYPAVSFSGAMTFDIDDIANMEANGIFEAVILHEMGHVIGVGTLWGDKFGECTTCRETEDGDASWTCPAAVSVYADLGGSGNDIIELDGGSGTSCGHLDEAIFYDELMTGYVNDVMHLSKMTAAILGDLEYIVDSSMVDPYILPSERGASITTGSGSSMAIHDTAVDTVIRVVADDGNVVDEVFGVKMEF